MRVANAWASGHSVPVPHITPSRSCLNSNKFLSLRKLNYLLGWTCSTIPTNPIYINGRKALKQQQQLLYCRCSSNDYSTSLYKDTCLDWDWNRWNRHFSEIEQAESFSSVLKVSLSPCVCN